MAEEVKKTDIQESKVTLTDVYDEKTITEDEGFSMQKKKPRRKRYGNK